MRTATSPEPGLLKTPALSFSPPEPRTTDDFRRYEVIGERRTNGLRRREDQVAMTKAFLCCRLAARLRRRVGSQNRPDT